MCAMTRNELKCSAKAQIDADGRLDGHTGIVQEELISTERIRTHRVYQADQGIAG